MKIPVKVLENIQQNQALQIEWAGHRDIYEVVEEWTDGLFWIINLWIALFFIYYYTNWDEVRLLAVGIFGSLLCSLPMLFETVKWSNEWHIITQDINKGGGLYFKAEGILNSQLTPLDIMKVLPVVDEYKDNVLYAIWKKLTNHRLQKVTLKSDAGFFLLDNNRMPPKFSNAWFRVRGPIAVTKVEDGMWHDIENLSRQMARQFYPERKGKSIIEHKIDQHFFN